MVAVAFLLTVGAFITGLWAFPFEGALVSLGGAVTDCLVGRGGEDGGVGLAAVAEESFFVVEGLAEVEEEPELLDAAAPVDSSERLLRFELLLAADPLLAAEPDFAADPLFAAESLAAEPLFAAELFAAEPLFRAKLLVAEPLFVAEPLAAKPFIVAELLVAVPLLAAEPFAAEPLFTAEPFAAAPIFAAEPLWAPNPEPLAELKLLLAPDLMAHRVPLGPAPSLTLVEVSGEYVGAY